MTLSSTSEAPARGLKLYKADRDKVRRAFTTPLHDANEKAFRAFQTEWAKRLPELIFSAEVRAALAVLKKAGLATSMSGDSFQSVEKKDGSDEPIYRWFQAYFGDTGFVVPNPNITYELPIAVLDEYKSAERKYNARKKQIDGELVNELNSVLLNAKTRTDLAELWPAVVTLMGEDWVYAQAERTTLPAPLTTNITAALEQITKAA